MARIDGGIRIVPDGFSAGVASFLEVNADISVVLEGAPESRLLTVIVHPLFDAITGERSHVQVPIVV